MEEGFEYVRTPRFLLEQSKARKSELVAVASHSLSKFPLLELATSRKEVL
jgi:hypothetical protein